MVDSSERRTSEERLTGRLVPPAPTRSLRAGPIAVELDGVALRRARDGAGEVFQMIYFAVRDPAWSNVPMVVSDLSVDDGPGDRFEVTFRVAHTGCGQDYAWDGRLRGAEDGSIELSMSGTTTTGLDYLRLGFCVLHGTRSFAGQPYRASLDGVAFEGRLPDVIGIQGWSDGTLHGLMDPFDRISMDRPAGPAVDFVFGGDDFEMEDQRNFGDASFKTYSGPIARGGPYHLAPGETLEQSVRVGLVDGSASRASVVKKSARAKARPPKKIRRLQCIA